jgi:hypothetical protein
MRRPPWPSPADLARALSRTVHLPCYLMRGWQAIDHAPAGGALSVAFAGSFFRPCRGWPLGRLRPTGWRPWLHSFAPAGAGNLADCGPRAGAGGYILSPLTGLVFDRLRQPFSSRRGLGQAFLAAGGGNEQPLPSRGIQERVGAIRPFLTCCLICVHPCSSVAVVSCSSAPVG